MLCVTLYFRAIFQVQAPPGAYIWRGDLTEVFLRYRFGVLLFGGAYTWRGLFLEFYGVMLFLFMLKKMAIVPALLDSPTKELCPKLCWHNLPNHSGGLASHSMGEGGGGEF